MQLLQALTFRDQTVALDNKTFVGCTLVNCVLEYSGGPVTFDSTLFRNCRYIFYGQARSTVLFLQEVGLMPFAPAEWGEFPEHVH